MTLRDYVPFPRLKQPFEIAYSGDFLAEERNPDKPQLRATIVDLFEQGMSYREIAQVVRLHWTRVGQIANRASVETALYNSLHISKASLTLSTCVQRSLVLWLTTSKPTFKTLSCYNRRAFFLRLRLRDSE